MGDSYTVYMHTVPNGKVYVGMTQQDPKERWNYGFGYSHNKHFFSAIKKYGWGNIQHEIICTHLSREEAEAEERRLIEEYKSANRQFGYNILPGGNATAGGWKHTDEARRRISQSVKGREQTEKQKSALASFLAEKRVGIIQYDTNAQFIAEYGSAVEAERETGIPNSNIIACCKGRYHSMNGYIFRYKGDQNEIIPYRGKRRCVCQFTIEGNYIRTFKSVKEAAYSVGVARGKVSNSCKFKVASSGGYIWLYEEETNRIWEKVEQYNNLKKKRK